MKIEALGDSAYILRNLEQEPYLIARALNASPLPGLIEAVASYETVGLFVDPFTFDIHSFSLPKVLDIQEKVHRIPVCYEMGEDLETAASALELSSAEVIELHSGIEYTCYALGFCPGFAYLGYLPEKLSGLPRLSSPRLRVPPGSVAITGRQTAVYPLERPGGWYLIGRTPLTLVAEDYFPIEAGDKVTFYAISADEFETRQGERL